MVSKKTLETVPIGTIINAVFAIDFMLQEQCKRLFEPGEEPADMSSRYKTLLDPDQGTPMWFYTGLPEEDNKAIVSELMEGTTPMAITSRIFRRYRAITFEYGPPVIGCDFLYEHPIDPYGTMDIELYIDDIKDWCGEEDVVVRALHEIQDGVVPDAKRCDELKMVLKIIEARMDYCAAIDGAIENGMKRLESVPGALSSEMRGHEIHSGRAYKWEYPYEGAGLFYDLEYAHNELSKYLANAGVEGMRFLDREGEM